MDSITSCFCCRKKIPKNEFDGLEGMVKLKNPEDIIDINNDTENVNSTLVVQNDMNSSIASNGEAESKRASSVPQRSLPDIPITEPVGNNDNYSDLYATVADKVEGKPSPTASLKKQTSISQHSSISQADVNSPYATVKNNVHGYDKVRKTTEEHPYAQLTAPVNSRSSNINNSENPYENSEEIATAMLHGNETNTSNSSSLNENDSLPQEVIPAAAAMLGMISASQELPYMTPPIVPQPNFSGDSQDSSKGYTSISVREPLANILAQTKQHQRLSKKQRNDSHYATVSDDSDEMYAAIEDPNIQADIYTSGSETYAQIQPTNQLITVSVEINTISTNGPTTTNVTSSRRNVTENFEHKSSTSSTGGNSCTNNSAQVNETTPIPPPVDTLFAQMHSRQASSSSNISYIGNIGSPKPEKRQANSPLPPTPKGNSYSNLSNQSGRNSAVIEESPPKDLDGMYAKVIKKSKFPNIPSQNNSPVLNRKNVNGTGDIQSGEFNRNDSFRQIEKCRQRSNSYDKTNANNLVENRKSEGGYPLVRQLFPSLENEQCNNITVEPGYESLPDTSSLTTNDPGYETLLKPPVVDTSNKSKPNSDYDPNYEVLQPFSTITYTNTSGDDGYAKVMEKLPPRPDDDDDDVLAGYSKVKDRQDNIPGYTSIAELSNTTDVVNLNNHGYASISEAKQINTSNINNNNNNNNNDNKSNLLLKNDQNDDKCSEIYSTIDQNNDAFVIDNDNDHKYSTIGNKKTNLLNNKTIEINPIEKNPPPPLPPLTTRSPERLSNAKIDLSNVTKENPYEKLKAMDSKAENNIPENGVVDDYFHV